MKNTESNIHLGAAGLAGSLSAQMFDTTRKLQIWTGEAWYEILTSLFCVGNEFAISPFVARRFREDPLVVTPWRYGDD